MRNYILLFVFLGVLKSGIGYSQDVNIKIGIKDSVQSIILNENRQVIISLPYDYDTSNLSYPVLFLLDGSQFNLLEAIVIMSKLKSKMIIVAIANTNRDRDMMPLSTATYEVARPGAENFLLFLEKELIPHIENNYRSSGKRILRGKSLSGLFTMYAFLKKPQLFESYIGNSAGWYTDMDSYFVALTEKSFKNKDLFNGRKLFVANSLVDSYDTNNEVHNAMLNFSQKIETELGDRIFFKYVTYDDYGHVPYPSFYDGLNYILKIEKK